MLVIKDIEPMEDNIITTKDVYEEDSTIGSIIDGSKRKGVIKEYQKVVKCGPLVRGIQPGDMVMITPKRFAVMKHNKGSLKDGIVEDNAVLGYNFDIVTMNGVDYLMLQQRDILYKFIGEETNIVQPEKSKIIV